MDRPLEGGPAHGTRIAEVDLGGLGRFLVASREVPHERFMAAITASIEASKLDVSWGDWQGDAWVSIAVPLGRGDSAEPPDRLYCYLPMGQAARAPLPCHVNAPFAVKLSREGLVTDVPLNDLLYEALADTAASAALSLREHPEARTLIPDLISWDAEHAELITEAFPRHGGDLPEASVLPILGDGAWGSFREAYVWPSRDRRITPAAVARSAGVPVVDPAIGPHRIERLQDIASALPDCLMDPSDSTIADWIEAIAHDLAREARAHPDRFDPEAWAELYDDVAGHYAAHDADELRGRRILIDDDFELHQTWGNDDDDGDDRPRTAIFFPMREMADDEDAESLDVSVPRSLSRHIAYLHADIKWRELNEHKRWERRPGRLFLDEARLVRLPRSREILQRLARILSTRRDKGLHADALRFAYNLTQVRPELQHEPMDGLHLRVPTLSGRWVEARDARFSDEWPGTLGPTLSKLIDQAAGVSADLDALASARLAPPGAFGFRVDSIERWTAFLRRIGVRDGLEPVECASKMRLAQGHQWMSSAFGDAVELSRAEREMWMARLQASPDRPHHPWTTYRLMGRVMRLPGAADHDLLPEPAKQTFGLLVGQGLGSWPTDALRVALARPRTHGSDPVRLPSPAQAFLAEARWLPVTRPGETAHDLVAPREAWHYMDDDSEPQPTFMSLVAPRIRVAIDRVAGSLDRFRALGLHVWNDPEEAADRLRLLARSQADQRVPETLIANFGKACDRTWTVLCRTSDRGDASPLGIGDLLVVTRKGRLGLYALSNDELTEPLNILVEEDRLVEAVLNALEVPVLRADPGDGRRIAELLGPLLGDRMRTIGSDDVRILVDGRYVRDSDGLPLVPQGREWLLDLVALTMELKASAFNRAAEKRIMQAVDTVHAIRLHAGERVEVEMQGQTVALPDHMRRAFALNDPTRPRIAFEGVAEPLDWETLTGLAPKIGDLVGGVETGNALQNIVGTLGRERSDQPVERPTDEEYSEALEESTERIRQLRRAQRGVVAGLLRMLRPAVAALLDGEDVVRAMSEDPDGPTDPASVVEALAAYDDRWPRGWSAASLVAAATEAATPAELRDALGITFGAFNAALRLTGDPPIHDTEGHAHAFMAYLSSRRTSFIDRLRTAAIRDFDAGEFPDGYARAHREFVRALLGGHSPTAGSDVRSLGPDASWLDAFATPDEAMLAHRVEVWLSEVAPNGGIDAVPLEPIDEMRERNRRAVSDFGERALLYLPVWAARRGGEPLPDWVAASSPETAVSAMSDRGLLDFRALDEVSITAWLTRLGHWSDGLPRSLELDQLGITQADIDAQHSEAERRRWERQLARRSVELDGVPVTLEPANIPSLVATLAAGISPEDPRSIEATATTAGHPEDPDGRPGRGDRGEGDASRRHQASDERPDRTHRLHGRVRRLPLAAGTVRRGFVVLALRLSPLHVLRRHPRRRRPRLRLRHRHRSGSAAVRGQGHDDGCDGLRDGRDGAQGSPAPRAQ